MANPKRMIFGKVMGIASLEGVFGIPNTLNLFHTICASLRLASCNYRFTECLAGVVKIDFDSVLKFFNKTKLLPWTC